MTKKNTITTSLDPMTETVEGRVAALIERVATVKIGDLLLSPADCQTVANALRIVHTAKLELKHEH
jgi:hypothetical protein